MSEASEQSADIEREKYVVQFVFLDISLAFSYYILFFFLPANPVPLRDSVVRFVSSPKLSERTPTKQNQKWTGE